MKAWSITLILLASITAAGAASLAGQPSERAAKPPTGGHTQWAQAQPPSQFCQCPSGDRSGFRCVRREDCPGVSGGLPCGQPCQP